MLNMENHSVIAPCSKETMDEATVLSTPFPLIASTAQGLLKKSKLLEDELNHVRTLNRFMRISLNNDNLSTASETSGIDKSTLHDRSSLGVLDVESMNDLSLDMLRSDLPLLSNNEFVQKSNTHEAKKPSIDFQLNRENHEGDFEYNRKSKSTESFKVNEKGSDEFFKQFLQPIHDMETNNVESTSFNMKDFQKYLVTNKLDSSVTNDSSFMANFKQSTPNIFKNDISLIKDDMSNDEKDLVYFDNGEYVTDLAFHQNFDDLKNDASYTSFSSQFQDDEFKSTVPVDDILKMLENEEKDFVKESKFKLNNSAACNNVSQINNSWMFNTDANDITRPSWFSPPSEDKSYMRISIGQFIGARTEALGSLGHEDGIERPNFGREIFSPTHKTIFEDEEPFQKEKNEKNDDVPTFDEENLTNQEDLMRFSKSMEEVIDDNKSIGSTIVSISTISKFFNDNSLNSSDPTALANMIIKMADVKNKDKLACINDNEVETDVEKKDSKTIRGDSLNNWFNGAGTVVDKNFLNKSNDVNIEADNDSIRKGSASSILPQNLERNDKSSDTRLEDNVSIDREKLKKSNESVDYKFDEKFPSKYFLPTKELENSASNWKESRSSSIYSQQTSKHPLDINSYFQNKHGEHVKLRPSFAANESSSYQKDNKKQLRRENSNKNVDTTKHMKWETNKDVQPTKVIGKITSNDRSLETCQLLKFEKLLCVGVSAYELLPLKNKSYHWISCTFKVLSLSINSKSIESNRFSSIILHNDKSSIAPKSSENLKISLIPIEEGLYSAKLEISYSLKDSIKNSVIIDIFATSKTPKLKLIGTHFKKLDFGTTVVGCSPTKTISIMNLEECQVPFRLRLRNDSHSLKSFKFCEETLKPNMHLASLTILCGQIERNASIDVEIKCVTKNIPSIAKQFDDLKHINSLLSVELDTPGPTEKEIGESLPVTIAVGYAKLFLKYDEEPLIMSGQSINQELKHEIQMKNFGNVLLHLKVDTTNSAYFRVSPSEVALCPSQEGSVTVFMYPQKQPTLQKATLLFMVQPEGIVYELNVVGKIGAKDSIKDRANSLFLESSRSGISWGGVQVDSKSKQTTVLRNSSFDKSMIINTRIMGSSLFELQDPDGNMVNSLRLALKPRQEIPVVIYFSPKIVTSVNAKLALQSTIEDESHTLQFSIKLSAHSGFSELTVKDVELKYENGEPTYVSCISQNSAQRFQFSISNNGNRSLFLMAVLFKDHACCEVMDSDFYTLSVKNIIIPPMENQKIIIDITKPRNYANEEDLGIFAGILQLYHGDEISRQKYRSALKLPLKSNYLSRMENDNQLSSLDFNCVFIREPSYKKEIIGIQEDISIFFSSIKKTRVKLYVKSSQLSNVDPSFYSLSIDESRLNDRSVNVSILSEAANTSVYPALNNSPPIRDVNNSDKAAKSHKKCDWEVAPLNVFITDDSNSEATINAINYSQTFKNFEISWPSHLLNVHPPNGIIPPNSIKQIHLSWKEHAVSRSQMTVSLFVSCDDNRKKVCVNLSKSALPNDVLTCNAREKVRKDSTAYKSLPIRINESITFKDTEIRKESEENFEIFNMSFHRIKWTLTSSALLVTPQDDSIPSIKTTQSSVFSFSKSSGFIDARQLLNIKVKFCPFKNGSFQQTWHLDFSWKEEHKHHSEIQVSGRSASAAANKIKTGPLRLSYDELKFPDTKSNTVVCKKITIKNTSSEAYVLEIQKPGYPFNIHHPKLKVKGKSYISLPIFFEPMDAGHFKEKLVIKSELPYNLTAILKGLSY